MTEKPKMLYLCNWDKNRQKSWSGTHFAIYNALQPYFDVMDYQKGLIESAIDVINRNLRKLKIGTYWLGKIRNQITERRVLDTTDNRIVFSFSNIPSNYHGLNYVYFDMNWQSVKNLYDSNYEIFKYSNFTRFNKKQIYKHCYDQNQFLKSCTGIFTMSKWLADELTINQGYPTSKVHYVGGGYNLSALNVDYTKKTGNKFLFVGRDFERKNGPLVVKAFKLIYEKDSSLRLYIAGPKKFENNHPGIVWLGDIASAELANYYNLCDVFVMPSKFEAYGLVFLEALTYGLPCIGRNAYEMPYLISNGETGLILDDDNPQTLADLMLNLIHNEKIKNKVRNNKEKYIKEYSWDAVAKRIYTVIESDIASNR